MRTGAGAIARQAVIDDAAIGGRELCRSLTVATDAWLVALHEAARAEHPSAPRAALLAIGGYGRGELAPYSDLDLLLVHSSTARDVEPFASAIWYPLWDAGTKLGHAVRTLDDQLDLARGDLDTATALLTARLIAGDTALAAKVVDGGLANWTKRSKRWLGELQLRVRERQQGAGEVAYTLEPDLKDGHGGLRDVQSLWWAAQGGLGLPAGDAAALDVCYATLLRARVGLHRATRRPGDVLRLEDQDSTAVASGHPSADALMADVAAAARTIAWIADEAWGRFGRPLGGEPDRVAPGVIRVNGEIELSASADPATDPTLVLRVAVAAARLGCRIERRTLDRLAEEVPPWPPTWPAGAADKLVALLLEGHGAVPVLEALDQRGLLTRLLPEWEPVRSRPQRNAYHRFTVDRHLWEAAANASELVDRVSRPDLLVLGALFHDIGKGYQGDHTVAGMEVVRGLGHRLGIGLSDTDVLISMVEHHLLLPDVALRRDLTDSATLSHVAESVGSVEVLDLLHALTEADSKATGPSAWGSWKEGLVDDLVTRVRHVLGGGDVREVTWRLFPDAETLALMAESETDVQVHDDRVTVVTADVPGSFSRVAGVLSLHGLDVLSAQAHSDEPQLGRLGMAASQFRVDLPHEGFDWDSVRDDLLRAIAGELAIEARLAERVHTYRRRRATQAQQPGPPSVVFHDDASSNASVFEVRAPNKIGILHRITKALAELGLDIRHATVQTIGMEVVDTFYVRTWSGELVTGEFHRAEIERAVLHAVS